MTSKKPKPMAQLSMTGPPEPNIRILRQMKFGDRTARINNFNYRLLASITRVMALMVEIVTSTA